MNSRVWTSHNGYSLGQSGYSLDVPRIVYFITHVYLYICILRLTRNVEPHWQLFPNTATFSTIARLQGFTTPKTGNGKRFQLLCHLQCGWSLSVFPKGCLALSKLNGQALNPFPTHCPENGAPWACKGATGSDAFWWETVLKVLGFRKATKAKGAANGMIHNIYIFMYLYIYTFICIYI